MNLVVLDSSRLPLDGDGELWRAVDGEPAYRRLLDADAAPAADASAHPGAEAVWIGAQLSPGELAAPPGAAALLMVGHDPADEDDFNAWMDTEHVPALGAVPGVLSARRFRAISGWPPYFAVYHLTGQDVLTSDAWKAAGATEWAARVRGTMRGRVRGLFVREG